LLTIILPASENDSFPSRNILFFVFVVNVQLGVPNPRHDSPPTCLPSPVMSIRQECASSIATKVAPCAAAAARATPLPRGARHGRGPMVGAGPPRGMCAGASPMVGVGAAAAWAAPLGAARARVPKREQGRCCRRRRVRPPLMVEGLASRHWPPMVGGRRRVSPHMVMEEGEEDADGSRWSDGERQTRSPPRGRPGASRPGRPARGWVGWDWVFFLFTLRGGPRAGAPARREPHGGGCAAAVRGGPRAGTTLAQASW